MGSSPYRCNHMITSIGVSQEIFAMDILKALKSSSTHYRKHVLRLLQLYEDQVLDLIELKLSRAN